MCCCARPCCILEKRLPHQNNVSVVSVVSISRKMEKTLQPQSLVGGFRCSWSILSASRSPQCNCFHSTSSVSVHQKMSLKTAQDIYLILCFKMTTFIYAIKWGKSQNLILFISLTFVFQHYESLPCVCRTSTNNSTTPLLPSPHAPSACQPGTCFKAHIFNSVAESRQIGLENPSNKALFFPFFFSFKNRLRAHCFGCSDWTVSFWKEKRKKPRQSFTWQHSNRRRRVKSSLYS